ncbi:phenylalanine--tRNA ligase subunit beta [Parvularcula marina]|uniref:phenylalanine--tRNA ligase subunit beta n=1 Tax=Parvularcula marina TaxID=2292771 RepID=UPI00351314A9
MKFTLSWLKKHLDTNASIDEIADAMVRIGLEVEEIENPADRLSAITVGYVKQAEKHPDADKLKVCKVDTKDGELQIVCGAPNAREGIRVAFAPVGTYIAGLDVTLSKAKIRGVESLGMMCSARELELGEDHDGIMELPEAAVGTPLADVLGLDDPVIDFEVTPNRPDTNGVDGVARDLAAAGLGTLISPVPETVEGSFAQPIPVEIDDREACPAFGSRLIRGVKNVPSPDWLQEQLRAIGSRPINALADITNYVSYDRARPLHVYDAAKLTGTVRARMGKKGESFLALDGKTYEVDETMCVIADDKAVLGLGGVMGGEESGCTDETTDVLIESALFDPLITARTGRKTGILSDARYRFERGVDPQSVQLGLDLATQLILEICGGEPSEIALAGEIPDTAREIEFPTSEVARLTGLDVSDSEKERILCALGFEVSRGGTWTVTPPSYRPDIEGKADLVEEIARIHGLDNLPTDELPPLSAADRHAPAILPQRERKARETMSGAGYHEAVTWAFCDAPFAEMFGGKDAPKLSNPISSDLGQMRPGALPNLLLAMGRNAARGARHVRLFELGGGYQGDRPEDQRSVVSAIAWGAAPSGWQGEKSAPDVFTAKSLAISVLQAAGVNTDNLMTLTDAPDHYHPGRKARLGLGPKVTLAHFGEVHPSVLEALDVPGPVAAMEVFLDQIPAPKGKTASGRPPLNASQLMPVRRDFAFVLPEETPAEKLLKAVRGAEKQLLTDVRLFDVYRGKGIGEGEKSLALEVTLQPREKTLTDEEIDAISARIVAQAEKTGAKLRG